MATTMHSPSPWQVARPYLFVFDRTLLVAFLLIVFISFVTMYSAASGFTGRFESHLRNVLIAFIVMWAAANLSPQLMMRSALPLYLLGLALLVGVALFGDVSKGARRWLNLGVMRIQPSELMKIAMPLMLAWYFQRREGALRWFDFLIATVLLGVPVFLIFRQPDLGTAVLVLAAGAYVIFFAGLSWRVIGGLALGAVAAAPLLWTLMKPYQKHRVMMLIDPTVDPLGKGFHIIQSTIAVGSGGLTGKGWMEGTQTHLEFIPERTTDFIFAVFSEEFGLLGNCVLLMLYLALISRGLLIAANGATLFMRLLAGAITMIFFTYAFVNMGMVSGVLPVVGVPLPFMSYGGTALVTLGLGAGLLMSINRHRKLVQI
ncbi:MAG TPA: rod shape-determining protein RodA [Burkholderiaceae bacterium]|nr:rod shape-determining protein RodA [Burkholderiaceae bacterium]